MAAPHSLLLLLLGTLAAGVAVGPIPDYHPEPELPDLDVPAASRLETDDAAAGAHGELDVHAPSRQETDDAAAAGHNELAVARDAIHSGLSYHAEDADPLPDNTEHVVERPAYAPTPPHDASSHEEEPLRAARRLVLTPDAVAAAGVHTLAHPPSQPAYPATRRRNLDSLLAATRFSPPVAHGPHPVHPNAVRLMCWGLAARCCYREADVGFLCVDDYAERSIRCTPRVVARAFCDGGGIPDPGAPPRPPVRLRKDETVTRSFAKGSPNWDDERLPATGASSVYFAPALPRAPRAAGTNELDD